MSTKPALAIFGLCLTSAFAQEAATDPAGGGTALIDRVLRGKVAVGMEEAPGG